MLEQNLLFRPADTVEHSGRVNRNETEVLEQSLRFQPAKTTKLHFCFIIIHALLIFFF